MIVCPTIIILATLLVYLPVLHAGFIWDDNDYVTENPALHDWSGFKHIWLKPEAMPQYYPLVYTTFWIEYHLWALHPLGYHLVNVVLHASGAVLLWLILRRLRVPGALLAALIFALHPVCVESVAWITERKNVLSAVCYFAAALAYLHFSGLGNDTGSDNRFVLLRESAAGDLNAGTSGGSGFAARRWLWLLGSFIMYLAALLSKTVACSLPAALLLLHWWKKGRLGIKDVLPLVPFFVMGACLGMGTAWLEKNHVGAQGLEWDLTFGQRCLIAGRALWFYAGKLICPVNLSFVYPRWAIRTDLWWQWLYPLVAAAVVIALWGLRRRWGRGPVVAVLFFAGTLFPALGFVNVYPMIYSFVADHFQYLAGIGLMVLASAGLHRLLGGWAYLLPLILGVLTWQETHAYRDQETLWRDTLAQNPSCWLALNNLGDLLRRQGKLDEAAADFQKALALKPDLTSAWNNLGVVLNSRGQTQAARECYARAIQSNPYFPEALANLASLLAHVQRFDEALPLYQRSLQINPNYIVVRYGYAQALVAVGRFDEAATQFKEMLDENPADVRANTSLAQLLARQGKYTEAMIYYNKVVEAEPDDPTAHYSLGGMLSAIGRTDDAIRQYEIALRFKPDYIAAHNNLGMAFATEGNLEAALEQFKTVLEFDPNDASACNNVGFVLDKLGRTRDAVPYLLKAVQLNPANTGAEQRLRQLGVTLDKP